MLFNGHFQIEADELAHVPVSKTVLSSENWSDFKNSLEVTHHTHLLVKLRRLS